MLDFVYLLVESGMTLDTSPGLAAQVLDRIRVQRSNGISSALVTVVTDQRAFDERIVPALDDIETPFICIPSSPLPVRLMKSAIALRGIVSEYGARLVYVRDMWSSMVHRIAYPFGGPELVYDMRGDLLAEAELRGRRGVRLWTLARITSMAIKHADQYAGVSSYTADLLCTDYGADEVTVIPSCVDTKRYVEPANERDRVRAELGVTPDDVLLVYAGGTHHYQLIPEMLRVWENMSGDDHIRFLLMTHQTEMTSELESILPQSRLTRLSVDRDRVPEYLAAADLGFLLRAPHSLNRVASPIKFGEYLASGLSVASSPGLGDVSRLIEQKDVGILVEIDDVEKAAMSCLSHITRIRSDRVASAARSRALASKQFDWSAYVPEWETMLSRVKGSN